jgi:hypothetical protein
MADELAKKKYFAILIGINCYPKRPLAGCVRDVQEIGKHLSLSPIPTDQQILTATSPGTSSEIRLAEEEKVWPTYKNVKFALERVATCANTGDFVYLHYSGHGVRTQPVNRLYKGIGKDFALALLEDHDGSQVRYLHGLELAQMLKQLANKGLFITLVLDCCFSGGIRRDKENDETVRSLNYDFEIDEKYPINLDILPTEGIFENLFTSPGGRGGSMLPNWILYPQGYTILTACGPHEVAKEIKVEGGYAQGALSYLLLRILKKPSSDMRTHFDIHKQLGALFKASVPRQNPIFYGNKDLSFFGPLVHITSISPEVVVIKDKIGLRIQAGQAHGFTHGDTFRLYQFDSAGNLLALGRSDAPCVRIKTLGPLTSEVELIGVASELASIRTGFRARAATTLALGQFPVCLDFGGQNRELWDSGARNRASLNIYHKDTGLGPFLLRVSPNNTNGYEIWGQMNEQIIGLPHIPLDHSDAVEKILDIVQHLVRYNHVRELNSKVLSADLSNSIRIRLSRPSGDLVKAGCVIELEDMDCLGLQVENIGKKPVYLHLYNLDPLWQVENILAKTYETLHPIDPIHGFTGVFTDIIEFSIPSELRTNGTRQCKDYLKVFVTTEPISLDVLEMPSIYSIARSPPNLPILYGLHADPSHEEDWISFTFEVVTSI